MAKSLYRHRQRLRISHDSLYNLHELSYGLSDFVHKIVTFPDVIVICGLKQMLVEVNRLLQLKSQDAQLLSYDTTFKLGDFYISPFLFHNVLFQRNPVMPAIFMIHEQKLKSTHDELMMIVANELSSLVHGTQTISMVTDEEKGFSSIEEHLPKVCRFLCWNHIINSAKLWLKSHGATSSEIPIYINNIRDFFHQESMAKYELHLGETKKSWSQPFLQYFMSEIHTKVM